MYKIKNNYYDNSCFIILPPKLRTISVDYIYENNIYSKTIQLQMPWMTFWEMSSRKSKDIRVFASINNPLKENKFFILPLPHFYNDASILSLIHI